MATHPFNSILRLSYATEDAALADWLTLKLTAEGYLVWCDRFKMLGGERWPEDIDKAIKNQTFRMPHLLSKYSLSKEGPAKERQLALSISKEREEDFLIPLKVYGLANSELPWRLSDINMIACENWANGLKQLLKKLSEAECPKPLMVVGKGIAANICES
jgi:hypothetical protein